MVSGPCVNGLEMICDMVAGAARAPSVNLLPRGALIPLPAKSFFLSLHSSLDSATDHGVKSDAARPPCFIHMYVP